MFLRNESVHGGGSAMVDYARFYLKAWDWRLFAFILLFIGLPNVYQL
ncbi:MAG: hypothetical protein O3B65_03805 [Chloroflexi bacterium]|nr:hypothetical protein [Chloroflexota bacterium]